MQRGADNDHDTMHQNCVAAPEMKDRFGYIEEQSMIANTIRILRIAFQRSIVMYVVYARRWRRSIVLSVHQQRRLYGQRNLGEGNGEVRTRSTNKLNKKYTDCKLNASKSFLHRTYQWLRGTLYSIIAGRSQPHSPHITARRDRHLHHTSPLAD